MCPRENARTTHVMHSTIQLSFDRCAEGEERWCLLCPERLPEDEILLQHMRHPRWDGFTPCVRWCGEVVNGALWLEAKVHGGSTKGHSVRTGEIARWRSTEHRLTRVEAAVCCHTAAGRWV